MREVCFAETVSALQHEDLFQRARPVNACQEPAEYVIALNFRCVKPEFRSFRLNFVLGDHWIIKPVLSVVGTVKIIAHKTGIGLVGSRSCTLAESVDAARSGTAILDKWSRTLQKTNA